MERKGHKRGLAAALRKRAFTFHQYKKAVSGSFPHFLEVIVHGTGFFKVLAAHWAQQGAYTRLRGF